MPHSLHSSSPSSPKSVPKNGGNGITKFTNCRILKGDKLVKEDVWVNCITGKIVRSQTAFFDEHCMPDETIDLGGRILSPGFIECQLNGAYGFNFSEELDPKDYARQFAEVKKQLVKTGVTSFIPTLTTQTGDLYKSALPCLAPSGHLQVAEDGAESLGAHCEGPFLNPKKNGIHNVNVMRQAQTFDDLVDCYGEENIKRTDPDQPLAIRMITAAPELGNMTNLIPDITKQGIVYSVGHSEATYEDASAAVKHGATMITHLFNAMRPLHHRNPGIFGVLGIAESLPRPYFGVIADGHHLHPTTVKIAFNAHPDGFILVTDAMHLLGRPDGTYEWTNGDITSHIVKTGSKLVLEGTETIAGSSTTLVDCLSNFLRWSGEPIPAGLKAVTTTPAAMLGLLGQKGCLDDGADADLVVLSEGEGEHGFKLVVDEVWKFGTKVFSREVDGKKVKA